MSVEASDADGIRVLLGRGELDRSCVDELLERLGEQLAGARAAVLDLGAVEFFDSSGVRYADRVARECARGGVAFAVVAPSGSPARRVLDLVGMGGGCLESRAQAAEALRDR